ncbi:hypothetical protein WR25_22193 [Diploscapter pachys]|uniref:Rab3GAP regulatory subunit C-terminal domain-containing protein n=1 Tax=Diploscapter pachys TaxID=2018661 RepID=A0A2A2K288_9BILA|nr:hypothetical protein WR25_22193 [Diploscapter pachys]
MSLNVMNELFRVAESVEIGPGPLAAIVDRAARIENRQIIRIWKGYRDAKVVFVSVASPETKLKTAVFLVIFVPRRALLEVWSIQNGVRVGAQHVDADGLLISGGSSTVLCGIRESEQSDAYFMDKSGAIFRIIVPYHFALLRNKSRDQHDEILLPKITNRNVFDAVIFEEIYSNLRTLKGRRQAILSVLNIVKNEEDVEKMLETINKVEGSQALGHLPELISNAQICYSKFHSWHGAEPRPKLDELQNLPFDSEANAIVGKHLEKEGNRLKSDYAITNFFSLLDWGTQKTAVLKKNYSDSDILSLTEFIFGPLLENQIDIEEFDEYGLTKLPFEESDILDLFSFYFLHSQDELSFTAFGVVKEFIAYLAAKSKNEGQILDHLERTAMTSPNNSRALLLYAIVNAIRREHKMDVSEEDKEKLDRENQEQEDDDDAKPEGEKSSDWIAYDPVLEHITAILTTMHCVCLTGKLTKLPNAGGHTFEAIWPKLNGFFREEVASWVVAQKIDQPDLENRLKEEPVILELIQKLPESLKSPLLNCDISWEYASRWFKGKAENFENLKLSIDFAEAISDSRLRHGVARLLWEKFVDEPFKATAMLMEKTGRAPKEREARQQLGFGESKVSDLLQSAERLLCILLESVRDSPSSLPFQQDTMIELSTSHPPLSLSGSAPRDSLVHLALRQSLVNYHLVLHHLHLAIALRLQVSIGMRLHPLKHLFCSIGLRAFFQPFDSHPLIPLDNVDEAVMERRHDFLNKVAEQCQESERKGARQLAAEWNLTVDSIALIQVISLLRKGQDSEAAQEIASVPQNDRLATALIRIVAARIVRLADEEKTTLTPNHSSLLCEFAGEETCRVENGSVGWRASLQSMGRLLSSLPNLPQVSIASLVKLNSLSEQYFALKFY